jgi:Fe2+ or Zn2+ uptake regulation protein
MMRMSKQRQLILRILRATSSHPTADEIFKKARREMPNISLGTIYRNLALLANEGKVLVLDQGGLENRFDATTQNHYHFRCEHCGRVVDVDEPVCQALDESVARKTGFTVSHHILEFRGLCDACQR